MSGTLEISLGKKAIQVRTMTLEGVTLWNDGNLWCPVNRTREEVLQRVLFCWPGLARYPLNQIIFVQVKPLVDWEPG